MIFNQYFRVLIESLLFVYFGQFLGTYLTPLGHFSDSTRINYFLTVELNYILNWITRVYLNWFWGCNIETNIELYHFSAKLKHWIESDMVSPTPISWFIGHRPPFDVSLVHSKAFRDWMDGMGRSIAIMDHRSWKSTIGANKKKFCDKEPNSSMLVLMWM